MYFIVRCGQSTVGIPAKSTKDAKNRVARLSKAHVEVLGACHPALAPTVLAVKPASREAFIVARDLAHMWKAANA